MLEPTNSASLSLSDGFIIEPLKGAVFVEMQAYLTGPGANVSVQDGNLLQVGPDGGLFATNIWADTPAW